MVGDKIVATTTVTVGRDGHAQAQSVLEAATMKELQDRVKRIRKSREYHR
jgi:hypothetical protein